MPQPGLSDLDEGYARLNERDPLIKLDPIIDWEACREPLSVLRNPPRTRSADRGALLQPLDSSAFVPDTALPPRRLVPDAALPPTSCRRASMQAGLRRNDSGGNNGGAESMP